MKFNPIELLTGLISPMKHIEAIAQQDAILTQEIHKVITVDLKEAARDSYKELKTQTSLLSDIKTILKDQNKQLEKSNSNNQESQVGSAGGFKPMSLKDTALTAVMIVGIAAAIVGAAAIFTFIPVVSPMQLLTALAVTAVMLLMAPVFVKIADVLSSGIKTSSASFKGMSVSKPDSSGVWSTMGATIVAMIGISIALVASAAILTLMPTIDGMQFLTALAVAVIMVPMSYAFLMFAKAIQDSKIGVKEIGLVALSIIAVAGSIVAVAYIFQMLPDEYKAPDPLWALKAGFATFVFAGSFYLIMKAVKGATLKELIFGSLALVAMSMGIVGLAYIFQALPDESAYKSPPLMWAAIAALSVLAFAFSFYLVMKAVRGASMKELIFGSLAIPLIAVSIMGVSWIFTVLADEFKAPDPMWVLKAGLALFIFAIPFALITIVFSKFNIGIKEMFMGIVGVAATAVAILAVSWIFSALPGVFNTVPIDWALETAGSIGIFAGVIGVIGTVIALSGGTGILALVAGVVGIILIAGAIWAVSWILSNVPTDFVAGMKNLANGIMAPFNAMIDVLARIKNEIGIDELPALAGGLVLLAGAWLTLTGALVGQSIGGVLASIGNLGTTLIDGISSFFGGEKTKTPFDLLDMLLDKSNAIIKIAKPIETVGKSFGQIASNTPLVVKGLAWFAKLGDEDIAANLQKSATASNQIATAYGKFAKAANGLNIRNVQASTAMFKAIADLSKPDALSGMKKLTDDLLKAVQELSKTVVNLEEAVQKQEETNKESQKSFGDVLSGTIDKATELIKGADTKVDKNTPKTKEELAAENQSNAKLIEAVNNVKKELETLTELFTSPTAAGAAKVQALT